MVCEECGTVEQQESLAGTWDACLRGCDTEGLWTD